ncbi:DUF3450 family protein [Cerasicoccus maritimus]|uniref:DUF3450 family protein n=1 Tax=Cerasicoccus maritimus TaxID=490089 RepID=UPI00285278E0|nr:DUF3450 family protein [Cerasicoccus maritimus]
MNIRPIAIALTTCFAAFAPAHAEQNAVAEAKSTLTKWVETRQLISEEKADWKVEQEFLTSTQELLQEQAATLEEQVKELEDSTTEADEKRNELLLERAGHQRAGTALAAQIKGMEVEVKQLVKQFPEPLQDKLEPLIIRIPDNPEESEIPLGQRLVNILGILAQAEKFNSTANFYGETREVGGQKISVLTLYWGMSFAVYVDTQGKVAGFGKPGPDGWVWEENNAIAPDAKRFIDMYEGNIENIEFVQLPIEIK